LSKHLTPPSWAILLRARAIETQAYVIAAAQAGRHNEKRESYGHSMIVDPWGKVLVELDGKGDEPQMGVVDIDLDLVDKVKKEMPLVRRTEVYDLGRI
jgi:predicted amidohydrolase